MSTKTTLKRIALVAVSALGFGLLSVAPSNAAANTNLNCTVAYTYATGTSSPDKACIGLAGPANSVTIATAAPANRVYVTITGGATTTGATSATIAAAGGTLTIATPTAGTITVAGYAETGAGTGIFSSTVTDTVTITVVAAATIGVVDTAVSTEVLDATGSLSNAAPAVAGTDDVAYAPASSALTDEVAVINVTAVDKNGTAMPLGTVYTASVTGPALLSISNAADATLADSAAAVVGKSGSARAVTVTKTAGAGLFSVGVYADQTGLPGVATVSIFAGTTLLSTETVTFYGAVASLTATVNNKQILTSAPTTAAVTVVAKDSIGQNVPVTAGAITVSSATTASIASGTCGASTATTGASCDLVAGATAGSSVLTFTRGTVTTTATVAASGKPTALTLSFDKTSYTPGEKFTLTLRGTNAAGVPGDATYAALLAGALSPSAAITTTLFGASVALKDGVATATGFMPINTGSFMVSGTTGADAFATGATAGVAISASVDVAGGALADAANAAADAAAEAIDAANAATDAANLAAEAADAATVAAEEARDAADAATAAVEELATQVATLMAALKAQLTTLANTVAKIAKKVKA